VSARPDLKRWHLMLSFNTVKSLSWITPEGRQPNSALKKSAPPPYDGSGSALVLKGQRYFKKTVFEKSLSGARGRKNALTWIETRLKYLP